jgi:hypothetical protein
MAVNAIHGNSQAPKIHQHQKVQQQQQVPEKQKEAPDVKQDQIKSQQPSKGGVNTFA